MRSDRPITPRGETGATGKLPRSGLPSQHSFELCNQRHAPTGRFGGRERFVDYDEGNDEKEKEKK